MSGSFTRLSWEASEVTPHRNPLHLARVKEELFGLRTSLRRSGQEMQGTGTRKLPRTGAV